MKAQVSAGSWTFQLPLFFRSGPSAAWEGNPEDPFAALVALLAITSCTTAAARHEDGGAASPA